MITPASSNIEAFTESSCASMSCGIGPSSFVISARSQTERVLTQMLTITEEMTMSLEQRAAAAQLIHHAPQGPHVARQAPLQVQDHFWSTICASGD